MIDRGPPNWLIDPMRWQQLFNDLESRFDDLARAEEAQAMPDLERFAQGATFAAERLRGALGIRIRLGTRTGRVAGELRRVGPDWLLLEESPGRELVVPMVSVTTVEGLTAQTGGVATAVDARLDLRFALRGLARDRAALSLFTSGGSEVNGTIDRVGADFVEVALHAAWEVRRNSTVRAVMLIPLAGIDHVRAMPLG